MSCASKERGDWDFVLSVCCVSLVELGKFLLWGWKVSVGAQTSRCPYMHGSTAHAGDRAGALSPPLPSLRKVWLCPRENWGTGEAVAHPLVGARPSPGGSSSLRDGRCCWSWCGTSSSPALLPLLPAVSAAFPPAVHRERDAGHRRELVWQWSTRSCALLTLEEFQSGSRDSAVGIGSSCRSVLWEVGYAQQPLRLNTALIPQEPSTLQLPGRELLARETHGKEEITNS